MGMTMKILVASANGYLGQGIVKSLLDFGNEVVAAALAGGVLSRDRENAGRVYAEQWRGEYYQPGCRC